jgi:hypothetical protein
MVGARRPSKEGRPNRRRGIWQGGKKKNTGTSRRLQKGNKKLPQWLLPQKEVLLERPQIKVLTPKGLLDVEKYKTIVGLGDKETDPYKAVMGAKNIEEMALVLVSYILHGITWIKNKYFLENEKVESDDFGNKTTIIK